MTELEVITGAWICPIPFFFFSLNDPTVYVIFLSRIFFCFYSLVPIVLGFILLRNSGRGNLKVIA